MSDPIPWKTIRALSFDVYGTLVDQNKGILGAARSTSVGSFLPQNDNELLRNIQKHSSELEQNCPSMRKSEINAECLRRYALSTSLVEDGKVSKEELDKAAEEFGSKMGTYPAYSDTVAALNHLRKHFKLIALSNVDHTSLKGTLSDEFGGNPFDTCYVAEDIGSYKPNHSNFRYLLEHLKSDFGIEQNQLCHVAQSLPVDHAATKPMGIRSVWVDRYDILGSSDRTPEEMQEVYGYKLRVESLMDLADIVDRAFAGN